MVNNDKIPIVDFNNSLISSIILFLFRLIIKLLDFIIDKNCFSFLIQVKIR